MINLALHYNALLARSPTIHRPQWIRWPQFSKCFLIDCLFVCKYSHFSPHPPLFDLSPLLFSYYKPFLRQNIHTKKTHKIIIGPLPDDPQTTVDKVASVFEFSDCLLDCLSVGKYSNFSPHPPLFP